MISENMFLLKKNGEPRKKCYCRHPELIENYYKAVSDTNLMWDCHHRKEEFYSLEELKERGEYFDVSPEELIFLTPTEHHKIDSRCKRISKANSKKVLCVETGETFESTMDAQRKTGISRGNISSVCLGKRNTTGGYHWQFV